MLTIACIFGAGFAISSAAAFYYWRAYLDMDCELMLQRAVAHHYQNRATELATVAVTRDPKTGRLQKRVG